MYFKDFPMFLYDFNYGDKVKTTVVKDITRNIRVRKEILSNISLYDEYDIIDGETPELISEKFYGSPEYHWVIMIANERYDWTSDFPLKEEILQRHIKTTYNPTLGSTDWYWKKNDQGVLYIYLKITEGEDVPFDAAYLTAPVKITMSDPTGKFVKIINFPTDEIGLDVTTQYFYFPYNMDSSFGSITQFGNGTEEQGVGTVKIIVNTDGRENNPVKFVNSSGLAVNADSPGAIPVTGAQIHREDNDANRRIKIISPSLLETLIKNYEEYLK
jgi:hypothetical protein